MLSFLKYILCSTFKNLTFLPFDIHKTFHLNKLPFVDSPKTTANAQTYFDIYMQICTFNQIKTKFSIAIKFQTSALTMKCGSTMSLGSTGVCWSSTTKCVQSSSPISANIPPVWRKLIIKGSCIFLVNFVSFKRLP